MTWWWILWLFILAYGLFTWGVIRGSVGDYPFDE